MRRERECLLSCIFPAETAHALIGQRNDHHFRQFCRQDGIDALRYGKRHKPCTDAQGGLCRQCCRPCHAERAGQYENPSARTFMYITCTRRKKFRCCILRDERLPQALSRKECVRNADIVNEQLSNGIRSRT